MKTDRLYNFIILVLFLSSFLLIDCNDSDNSSGVQSFVFYKDIIDSSISIDSPKINNDDYNIIYNLLKAYPDFLDRIEGNYLVWRDSTKMLIDDGIKNKSYHDLLNNPCLKDQLIMQYPAGINYDIPTKNFDPGRVRYEPFFRKMYGENSQKVKKNLVPIQWLPNNVNRTLMITSVNNIDKKLQKISDELDSLDHLHKYLDNPAGTFYWRKILGTERLSTHSFGIAIDINVEHSNYWKWDMKNDNDGHLKYVNRIPLEIVEIFERHGFIWGGKWYHYDTMHFEYRPELLTGKSK